MNSIAVTGAKGQLGGELCLLLGESAVGLDLPEFDLCDDRATRDLLSRMRPRILINAAAYTQVDRAEEDVDTCFAVNAQAVQKLAAICQEIDCVLVQLSTDYVFGEVGRTTPYLEDDAVAPLGVYGRSKLQGEEAARSCDKHYIIRTAGLYAPARDGLRRGRNFVETMLLLGQQRDQLSVVNDQLCSTTYAPDLALAILHLVEHAEFGTYHVANTGQTNWFEFASEILQNAGRQVAMHAITTQDYGAPAPRPMYSVLDTGKYHDTGGPAMPSWREALAEFFRASNWEREHR